MSQRTLAQTLLAQIPKSVDITNLKLFLQSQELGVCDVFTNDVCGFRFRRLEKEPGAYYRDPYPLTVSVFSAAFHLPIVEATLQLADIQELLTSQQ